MKLRLIRLLRRVIMAVLYSAIGALAVLITGFVVYLNNQADLHVWHQAQLDQEFTVDSDVNNFKDYMALEERLFQQLDSLVYEKISPDQYNAINRYNRGSLSDPTHRSPDWNRSFIFPSDSAKASVLLLHGMSDSPYSLRHIGERLNAAGAYVLGLRLPGHGAAPSGLTKITWQDMAASVRLAMRHLAQQNSNQPIYIIGYSNGAALAVNYALETLADKTLPGVERIVILSPAIGVTPVAALAIWQARLGHLLGLKKLAWNSILPEYDPYKFNSFAVNAGNVVYQLTNEIQDKLTTLGDKDKLKNLPPILAFSSVVDATVVTPALVNGLFDRLPSGGHELVLFDINHNADIKALMKWDPDKIIQALQAAPDQTFALTIVTNRNKQNKVVSVYTKNPGEEQLMDTVLELQWPKDLYSLAHVALPFPENDPLYGGRPEGKNFGLQIGKIVLRGERGVLWISGTEMMRLRWNPFYPYIETRVFNFLSLESP